MKTFLIALPMSLLAAAAAAPAQADPAPTYSPAVAALRAECAQKYSSYSADKQNDKSYEQKYDANGKYAGKYECTEDQYAAYLDTVEPERVMAAYPSGAGRPMAKPADSKYDDKKYDDKKYDDKKTDDDSK